MKVHIESYMLLFAMMVDGCFQECSAMTDDKPIQSDVTRIYEKLVNEEIGQIDILHIPASVETYSRVTPERLQEDFFYRLTILRIRRRPFEKELAEALKTFKVQPMSEGTDLRWGIVFLDHEKRRVGAIFFGGVGGRGVIGNTNMSCNNSLFEWLVSHFSCCFGEQNGGSSKDVARPKK